MEGLRRIIRREPRETIFTFLKVCRRGTTGMTLRVSGKNMDIGESLRTYAEQRINALVERYFKTLVNGHSTISPEGSGYRAECVLHLSPGMTLHAEATAQEPYACFDRAAERVEKRLRRYKERLKSRSAGHASNNGDGMEGSEGVSYNLESMSHYVIESPTEEEENIPDFTPLVIAEMQVPVEKLSVTEAVGELDLSGAPLVVFYHARTERLNIVYRRPDGHISWMDPPPLAQASDSRSTSSSPLSSDRGFS